MFIIPLLLTWTVSVFISAEIWWGKQLIMKNVPPVSKAHTDESISSRLPVSPAIMALRGAITGWGGDTGEADCHYSPQTAQVRNISYADRFSCVNVIQIVE